MALIICFSCSTSSCDWPISTLYLFCFAISSIPLIACEKKFSFNLGDVQIPASVESAQSNQNDKRGDRRSGAAKLKGSVIMTYSDYKINTGIPDSFFDEKKK